MLEPRLVLSSFTWTGLDSNSPTLWSDGGNWLGGVVPSPGSTVNFLPLDSQTDPSSGESYPTEATVAIDSADVSTINVDDSYTFQAADDGSSGTLTLDPNSSIAIDATGSLTLAQGLQVNFPGSATVSFSGNGPDNASLLLQTQEVKYPGTPGGLRPVQIGGNGTMILGSTTTLLQWNVEVGQGSTASVPDSVNPSIGSLSGGGEVNMDGAPGDGTHLSLNPPPGSSEDFDGTIDGSGGVVSMDDGNAGQGQIAGVQFINNINPDDSGAFALQINAGTMVVDGTVDAQQLTVASGATFGGPAQMNISGVPSNQGANADVTFDPGSTFVVTLDGTARGAYTALTDTDADPATGSTVELNGSTLAAELGPGFAPSEGEHFTVISTPGGTIGGQFGNASNGSTVNLSGVPYLVTYNKVAGKVTSVELTVEAIATTTRVALAPGSINPSAPSQAVTFVATVAGGSDTPTGSVAFYDGEPGAGGTEIGTAQTLAGGEASLTIATLSTATHAIYAVYQPSGPFTSSVSTAYDQTVSASTGNPPTGNPRRETPVAHATVTHLSSSANPGSPGQPLTLTATVTATGGPVPGGVITFTQGATILGTVPLSGGGTATLTTSALPPGSDPITASYGGSAVDMSSTASLTQAVNPYTTTLALTLVMKKVKHRKVFELEATVATSTGNGSAPLPAGSVIFLRKKSAIGTVVLEGGVAALQIGGTRPRNKPFTASFMGSPEFSQSSASGVF